MTAVGIRGQNNLYTGMQNDQAVGIYLDGVFVPRPAGSLMDLVDMERVEILRGPQGTLFGRNTTGGAFNMITHDPVEYLEGSASAEIGNYSQRNARVMLNLPIAEGLSGRIVYNFRDRDGYAENVTLNRRMADLNSHFVRAKLKYESGIFAITLSGDYNKYKDNGTLTTLIASNPPATSGPLFTSLHSKDNWWRSYAGGVAAPTSGTNLAIYNQSSPEAKALYAMTPFNQVEAYGFSATLAADLGAAQIKSITGFRYNDSRTLIDSDSTASTTLGTFAGQRTRQISEELQLSGDISDRLSYITGAYISRETGYDNSYSQIFGGPLRANFATAKNISKGLFAQVYYDLASNVRAVGGFRYTWDTRDVEIQNRRFFGIASDATVPTAAGSRFNCSNTNVTADTTSATNAAAAAACSQPQSAKFTYPAWTAGIDWRPSDDVFVYLKTSGAARAGGWNVRAGALPFFKPEKVKDVEGGVKLDLFDRRVRLNTSAFHIWKSGIQTGTNVIDPVLGSTQYTVNNGDARIWGAEFELTVQPWEGMDINGSLALTDGKYKKGTFIDTQRITGFSGALPSGCSQPFAATPTTVDCRVDFGDNDLLQLPKTQFNIGATQTVQMPGGELALHLDYAYISAQKFFTIVPAAAQPAAVRDAMNRQNALSSIAGYGLVNGRISYQLANPDIEIYVYARNLFNNKYLAANFVDLYRDLGFAMGFPGAPRFFGGGVTWKFGGK